MMENWDTHSWSLTHCEFGKANLKSGGLICFTINEGIHEEYGFDKKIISLNENNKWKEIEFFKSDYIASKDVNAWLGLYRVTKDV